MRVSDATIDTFEPYNFSFGETANSEPMELEQQPRITRNALLEACDTTTSALIMVTHAEVLIKVEPMEGTATPAMLELAMLAHKLFSFNDESFVTHFRNTIMVIRQPGAHNPFQVSETEPTQLRALFTESNARALSFDLNCHLLLIMQDNQGKISAHSQYPGPFQFVSRLQLLYAVAKSIETNARGIFASIVPHLNESDRAIMDRVSKAVDAL